MIITPRFVYLHLHKTGGTFVNECLLRFVDGARQYGYHLPRRMIPEDHAQLPVLGFCRNPWSYYVSWYSFQSSRPQPNALFNICSDYGARDFRSTITQLVNLCANDEALEQLLPLLPNVYVGRGLNLPRFALEQIRGTGLGFFSFLHRYMFSGPGQPAHVGRAESLRQDLMHFLDSQQLPVSDEFRQYVAEQGRRNASAHGDYEDYYDAPLRELIARRDAEIVDTFGYRFGASS